MKSLLTAIALLGLFSAPAMAEPRFPVSAELTGMEKVMGVIGNTNLSQNETRAYQSLLDILETKNQVNALSKPVAPRQVAGKKPPASRAPKSF